MPDMGTIATVLTVNAAPAQKGFSVYRGELASVQRATAGFSRAAGGGSGGAAFAMLEVGRAAEDAAVGFGVNGLQGALRGSINNLTSLAMLMGGPLVGAIAGVTAAGVSLLANYFLKQPKAADDATAALKRHTEAIKEMHEERRRIDEFNRNLPGMGMDDLRKEGEDRGRRIDDLRAALQANDDAREALVRPNAMNQMAGRAAMFGVRMPFAGPDPKQQAELLKFRNEEARLLEERLQIERELERLEGAVAVDVERQVREWRQEIGQAQAENEAQRLEERKQRFFNQPDFWKDIDFDLKQREGRGLPGFGAPQRGTVAAQSAILRAGQNRDRGVSEKQLKALEDIKRDLNKVLQKNALGLGVIALP